MQHVNESGELINRCRELKMRYISGTCIILNSDIN